MYLEPKMQLDKPLLRDCPYIFRVSLKLTCKRYTIYVSYTILQKCQADGEWLWILLQLKLKQGKKKMQLKAYLDRLLLKHFLLKIT